MGLAEWLAQRRAKKKLERILAAAEAAALNNASGSEFAQPPQPRRLQFVLINVRESAPEEMGRVINRVGECIYRCHAAAFGVSPSFITAYLGFPWKEHNSAEERRALVAELLRENGTAIRIVHGECTAMAGNFGANFRFVYDALLPNYEDKLKSLLESEFGVAKEWSE